MSQNFMLEFSYKKRTLKFTFDAGTSRGVLRERDVYWIKAYNPKTGISGWGEAAPLTGLSLDFRSDFEQVLKGYLERISEIVWPDDEVQVLNLIQDFIPVDLPSIRFGIEMAVLDFINGGVRKYLENDLFEHSKEISINGLIWMGTEDFMLKQIKEKLGQGFTCIKMKIGAIDFQQELKLLAFIRQRFDASEITLRVDANGAFSPDDALRKLEQLAKFNLHSIEQPIMAGQISEMSKLCKNTPVAIALDEELIGFKNKAQLLDEINPQYIILKPTLVGGIFQTKQWIAEAENRNIGWWMTSALESNIGLNAIAQLTSSLNPMIPQGLGTGQLYHNNLSSPLEISDGKLRYRRELGWENPF